MLDTTSRPECPVLVLDESGTATIRLQRLLGELGFRWIAAVRTIDECRRYAASQEIAFAIVAPSEIGGAVLDLVWELKANGRALLLVIDGPRVDMLARVAGSSPVVAHDTPRETVAPVVRALAGAHAPSDAC